ncbi:MAG: CRISPR-associated helicase Cas3' [Bacteroidetes bacterium]|nr:CRISPR-associated helicase Cas3' [Bacteroidota bacterium]
MAEQYVAHCKKTGNNVVVYHSLPEHLHRVAQLAGTFAAEFGNRDWGEYIGYLHDLGKYHPLWQQYIRTHANQDENLHIESQRGKPPHSGVGALVAVKQCNNEIPSRVFAYTISGHHSGLSDWYSELECRLLKNSEITSTNLVQSVEAATSFLNCPLPITKPCVISNEKQSFEHLHLWIRMLFSCLVDADFLDTEEFMEPEHTKARGTYLSLHELKKRFDYFIAQKEQQVPDTPINRKRKEIRTICVEKAKLPPGTFSLTVPTGGGKTLSSLAFALEHALHFGKRRIIIAIPYTSIIEQTAKILKYGTDNDEEIIERKNSGNVLFGEDQVVEHHSNIDPREETARNRLACENWDAPIIITTNVELFESLFANTPSMCRKLHNIVNSVIILDEVQLLPPEHLKPILSVLRGLVDHFGVTVVMMTATQPLFEGTIGRPPTVIQGLHNVRPIIDDPESLAREWNNRVEIIFPKTLTNPMNWENVRDELLQHEQVLCIVNSRKDCRELHNLMPEDTIHLSALMCGEERSVIISTIKEKLRQGKQIRVISTQVVEAGVDIDFPVVYRALTGFDSLAQAAGRCNREGKLPQKGKVIVFIPPKPSPRGLLRYQEDACKELLRNNKVDELSPQLFKQYFEYFYARLDDMDKPRFYERLVKNAPYFVFAFRSFAQEFNLIDEVQQSIVVWYTNPKNGNNSEELIKQLQAGNINRNLLRKLQRFVVNVHLKIFENIRKQGFVQEVAGYWIQSSDGLYKPGLGLELDDTKWLENCVI